MGTITLNMNYCVTIWEVSDNSGDCSSELIQQLYTSKEFESDPTSITYFYTTPILIAANRYAPGIGTLSFSNISYGSPKYTANMTFNGLLAGIVICGG